MKFLLNKLYNSVPIVFYILIILLIYHNILLSIVIQYIPYEYCCSNIDDDIDRSIEAMNSLQDQLDVITDRIKELSTKYGHDINKWPEGQELFSQKLQMNDEISRLERRVEWLMDFQEDASSKNLTENANNSKKNLKRNCETNQEEYDIKSKKR